MADLEARKRLILLKRLLREHLRRSASEMRLEEFPDHNPMVLQDCPRCHGRGQVIRCVEDAEGFGTYRDPCDDCLETGITGELEPYFALDAPEVEVVPNSHGAVRCPACKKSFKWKSSSFTGLRHRSCGQRIKILTPK